MNQDKTKTIQTAAQIFATETRSAERIAAKIGVCARTVHRYAKTEIWQETLNTLEYAGERGFSDGKRKRSPQYFYVLLQSAARARKQAIQHHAP